MKILQIHNEYIFYGGEDTVVANERNLLEMNGHIVHQLIRKNKSEVKTKVGEELVNVFVPTTPNPTSGFLLMISRKVSILESLLHKLLYNFLLVLHSVPVHHSKPL